MAQFSLDEILSGMMDAATQAGNLTRNASPEKRANLHIAEDLVTLVDIEADKLIRQILTSAFPEMNIYSEEVNKTDNDQKSEKIIDYSGFLVDPIDGSVNFARAKSPNYGNYAISIAYAEDGTVLAGVVHKPLENEMFSAIRGYGAFQDGNPIQVSDIDNLNYAAIELGSYWIREKPELFIKWFTNKQTDVEQILIRGSAAAGLADVARGRVEGMFHSKLHPWDYAAGWVMVEEAGGVVMDGECNPLKLGSRYIYATNKKLNDIVKRILTGSAGVPPA